MKRKAVRIGCFQSDPHQRPGVERAVMVGIDRQNKAVSKREVVGHWRRTVRVSGIRIQLERITLESIRRRLASMLNVFLGGDTLKYSSRYASNLYTLGVGGLVMPQMGRVDFH